MHGIEPPWEMAMPQGWQTLYTIAVTIPWMVFIFIAVRRYFQVRDVAPALFLIGGLCCTIMEPIVDVMGMCFFPVDGQWVGFETFEGRPIPIWMFPIYSWFVGGQAYLLWRRMQKGTLTNTGLFKHWFIAWGVNIILETPGLLVGVYTYYGPHAFNFWGLPLWWPSVNATMPVIAAFIIHKSWVHIQGWKLLTIIPILPIADGLVNGGVAWPTWSALHSGNGLAATYPAAVLTIALGMLSVWLVSNGLPSNNQRKAGTGRTALDR